MSTDTVADLMALAQDYCVCQNERTKGALEQAIRRAVDSSLEAAKQEPLTDKGPWHVSEGGSLFSDDFEHDVRLWISGDFESREQRLAYARALCAQLNAAAPSPGSGT